MYKLKVDSCKLSIPLQYCSEVSQDLVTYYKTILVNTETGELIDKESKEKREPFTLHTDYGTYFKLWIEPQTISKGVSEEFLSVLVNSKHLGVDYFKGITKETLIDIYNVIMSLNVFKCSYESFSNARYQDTDIAFDFETNKEHFEILKENIKRSTLFPDSWASTSKKDNSGIWAPKTPSNIKPRDFATPSKPYVKFYDKQIDFETKSNVFAKHFNLIEQSKNIVRFEATIKNAEHKKLLKITNLKTIADLLNSDLHSISKDMFRRYFEKRKFVKSKEETPMDKVLIDLINTAIENGANKQTIFKIFDRSDVSRKSNYNLVQKYHALYSEEKINIERLEANELSTNIFDFLGIDTQTKLPLE